MMEEAGLPCCILKGQGIALSYPDPTARVPGDIDIWVMAPPRQVIAFARKLQIHSPAGLTIYAIVNNLVDISSVKL